MKAANIKTVSMPVKAKLPDAVGEAPVTYKVPRVVMRKGAPTESERRESVKNLLQNRKLVAIIPSDETSTWDTQKHTPAYYQAVYSLKKFDEREAEKGMQREQDLKQRQEEGNYFPMSLPEDEDAEEQMKPAMRHGDFRSNYYRIQDTVETSEALAEEDEGEFDVIASNEPAAVAQPDETAVPVSPPDATFEGGQISHLSLSAAVEPKEEAESSFQITGNSSTFDPSMSEVIIRDDHLEYTSKDDELIHSIRGCVGTDDPVIDISLIYKEELASLFNAVQKHVKVKVDHGLTEEEYITDRTPLAVNTSRQRRTKVQKNGISKSTGNNEIRSVTSDKDVVGYLVDVISTSETPLQIPSGGGSNLIQYTSPFWNTKQKVLETILSGSFDINHVSELVSTIRSLHEELQNTRVLLYRCEDLLLREKLKNETLVTREEIASYKSKYRKMQVAQLVERLDIEGDGSVFVDLQSRAKCNVADTWKDFQHVMDERMEEIVSPTNSTTNRNTMAMRSIIHEHMIQELKWKTLLSSRNTAAQQQLEAAERNAMEGADLMSAAAQYFILGDLETSILNQIQAIEAQKIADTPRNTYSGEIIAQKDLASKHTQTHVQLSVSIAKLEASAATAKEQLEDELIEKAAIKEERDQLSSQVLEIQATNATLESEIEEIKCGPEETLLEDALQSSETLDELIDESSKSGLRGLNWVLNKLKLQQSVVMSLEERMEEQNQLPDEKEVSIIKEIMTTDKSTETEPELPPSPSPPPSPPPPEQLEPSPPDINTVCVGVQTSPLSRHSSTKKITVLGDIINSCTSANVPPPQYSPPEGKPVFYVEPTAEFTFNTPPTTDLEINNTDVAEITAKHNSEMEHARKKINDVEWKLSKLATFCIVQMCEEEIQQRETVVGLYEEIISNLYLLHIQTKSSITTTMSATEAERSINRKLKNQIAEDQQTKESLTRQIALLKETNSTTVEEEQLVPLEETVCSKPVVCSTSSGSTPPRTTLVQAASLLSASKQMPLLSVGVDDGSVKKIAKPMDLKNIIKKAVDSKTMQPVFREHDGSQQMAGILSKHLLNKTRKKAPPATKKDDNSTTKGDKLPPIGPGPQFNLGLMQEGLAAKVTTSDQSTLPPLKSPTKTALANTDPLSNTTEDDKTFDSLEKTCEAYEFVEVSSLPFLDIPKEELLEKVNSAGKHLQSILVNERSNQEKRKQRLVAELRLKKASERSKRIMDDEPYDVQYQLTTVLNTLQKEIECWAKKEVSQKPSANVMFGQFGSPAGGLQSPKSESTNAIDITLPPQVPAIRTKGKELSATKGNRRDHFTLEDAIKNRVRSSSPKSAAVSLSAAASPLETSLGKVDFESAEKLQPPPDAVPLTNLIASPEDRVIQKMKKEVTVSSEKPKPLAKQKLGPNPNLSTSLAKQLCAAQVGAKSKFVVKSKAVIFGVGKG